ncbi:MAG: hypothetical protein AAGH89_16870, partial [Verrucomicrobiota bacterium]
NIICARTGSMQVDKQWYESVPPPQLLATKQLKHKSHIFFRKLDPFPLNRLRIWSLFESLCSFLVYKNLPKELLIFLRESRRWESGRGERIAPLTPPTPPDKPFSASGG